MSAAMNTSGLRLDQAPPLEIPMSFFLTAPFAAALAGLLLMMKGTSTIVIHWAPLTIALTHLGTLGFLAMIMIGALYQITPVVAGIPVPKVHLAHWVHALLVSGVLFLIFGLFLVSSWAVMTAITLLTFLLLLFTIPVGRALAKAPVRSDTVRGMRLALGCFFIAAFLGLWMAHGHGGMKFPGSRGLWIQIHLGFGLLGWIGGLITAVSWQLLPMFYLTPNFSKQITRLELVLISAGLVLPPIALGLDYVGAGAYSPGDLSKLAALGVMPAVFTVWILHPILALRNLAARRRRNVDASLYFWKAALLIAPVAAVIAGMALCVAHPQWKILFGWLAIWGWAGLIVHGMLTRIVPFLVWFHRFSPHIGHIRVPSVRKLLPDTWTRRGFALHLASLLLGCVAILTASDWIARLTGLLLLATAINLSVSLFYVSKQHPEFPETTH